MANEVTSANAAQAILKLVASKALPALGPNFVMGPWVNRNYDDVLAQMGDVINVPIAPNMTTNNIAEGGTVTNQNPTLGNAQVVLNTHREATFTIINVAQALASPSLIDIYMQPAILAVADQIEADLIGTFPLFTANSVLGTGAAAITEATIDSAESALFNARMNDSIQKYALVGGTGYSQLRQIPRFSEERMVVNNQAIANGTVGKLKGVIFARSQKVSTLNGNTTNLMFGSDAIVLAMRNLPLIIQGTGAVSQNISFQNFALRVVMSYNPQVLAQQFTVDALYGVAALRKEFGQQILN